MIVQLNEKAKIRRKEGLFTAEGRKMFLEAPPGWIRKVYISSGFENREVLQKIEEEDIACETVTEPVFRKMSDTQTPQGVLTLLEAPSYPAEELIRRSFGTGQDGQMEKAPLWMILENLQDPGNLGTILRTGEGAGISGVLMTRDCADILSPKTVRATMGSVYRVPFAVLDDIRTCTELLREYGIRTFAAHLDGRNPYDRESYREPSAFMIGNEGNGLSGTAAASADRLIRIPMHGEVESLNAAMAAGILMYEAARQRAV